MLSHQIETLSDSYHEGLMMDSNDFHNIITPFKNQ